jgi:hypothetical protein
MDAAAVVDSVKPYKAVRPARSRFYFAMALFMTGIVIAGFWPSYYGPLLRGSLDRHWVIHIHGAVFTGWMALLLAQVILVARGRIRLHRMVGRAGIAYGAVVVIVGLAVSVVAPVLHVMAGEWPRDRAAGFFLITFGDMALFGGLFGAAIAYRRKPDVHKRLMVLATIALLFAAVGRLPLGGSLIAFLSVWLIPLFIAVAHDWVTRRSIHPVYVAGSIVLPLVASRVFFERSEAWLVVGRAILEFVLPATGL